MLDRKRAVMLLAIVLSVASPALAHTPPPSFASELDLRKVDVIDESEIDDPLPIISASTFDDVARIELPPPSIVETLEQRTSAKLSREDARTHQVFTSDSPELASWPLAFGDENNINGERKLSLQLHRATEFHALPFVEPATGLVYARARWYSPSTATFLSPDPMGYRDSSNVYAGFSNDPVNARDPRGEAVYLLYREFAGGGQKLIYPLIGHFFLAFDGADLPNPARWEKLVDEIGGQEEFTGSKRTPERRPDPDAETFSFHPAEVSPYDDGSCKRVSTVVTTGSFIGYNDEVDQLSFRRGRATLQTGRAFNPPLDREYVWKVHTTQDQQEALYKRAVAYRLSINGGWSAFGPYLLGENNCGT